MLFSSKQKMFLSAAVGVTVIFFAVSLVLAATNEERINLGIPIGSKGAVQGLADYIGTVYNFLVGVAGLIATVLIMWGGIKWITAGGDPSKIGQAKETIVAALVGLFLALGSYVILQTVNPVLLELKVPFIEKVKPSALKAIDCGSYKTKNDCDTASPSWGCSWRIYQSTPGECVSKAAAGCRRYQDPDPCRIDRDKVGPPQGCQWLGSPHECIEKISGLAGKNGGPCVLPGYSALEQCEPGLSCVDYTTAAGTNRVCTNGQVGSPCRRDTDCVNAGAGALCLQSLCTLKALGELGASCVTNAECQSGYCAPDSKTCANGLGLQCTYGGGLDSCPSTYYCRTAQYASVGQCQNKQASGNFCLTNRECLSGSCAGGVCQ